jgi:hypothetical protein
MRCASDLSIAVAFFGVVLAACSSDDSTPSMSANGAQTDVEANQPDGMNAVDGLGNTSADSSSSARDEGAGAAEGASGDGNAETPARASADGEGTPSDVGLDEGADSPANAGGGDADGDGDDGASGNGDANEGQGDEPMNEPTSELGVFVATASDSGGDLGGLEGADATCQALADEAGAGDRTFRAYLSTSTVDARDRIGEGPWVNANSILVATDLDDLHSIIGDVDGTLLVDLFVDHEGNRINGQWAGSPGPNQHDILTGSAPDGTRLPATCSDWTSSTATPGPQVGHSDGLGPGMNAAGNFGSWNSSHAPQGCSQQQLNAVGGAGRFYCFAAD